MKEIEVYEPLANWMQQKLGFEWHKITHENACIIINENEEKKNFSIYFHFYL